MVIFHLMNTLIITSTVKHILGTERFDILLFNPLLSGFSFLYPLKTPEKSLRFSDIFRVYRKEAPGNTWLVHTMYRKILRLFKLFFICSVIIFIIIFKLDFDICFCFLREFIYSFND